VVLNRLNIETTLNARNATFDNTILLMSTNTSKNYRRIEAQLASDCRSRRKVYRMNGNILKGGECC
jgi:hypothetical protein